MRMTYKFIFIFICLFEPSMASVHRKWEEFHPKIVQTDKRERDNVPSKGIKMVKKNFNELGISSFVSVPIIDRNITIQKILHVYPPNSPLEAFFMEKANRKFIKGLEKALEDTQMWGLELWFKQATFLFLNFWLQETIPILSENFPTHNKPILQTTFLNFCWFAPILDC